MFRISISELVFPIVIKITFFLIVINSAQKSFAQTERILVGAEQTELYFKDIKNKRIAVVANQTSRIRSRKKYVHLIDTLISMNINVKKVFARSTDSEELLMLVRKFRMVLILKQGFQLLLYMEKIESPPQNILKTLML